MNVLVNTIEQFDVVTSDRRVHIIYCELTEDFKKNYNKYIEKCHKNNIKLYAALPRIERKQSEGLYTEAIQTLKQSNIDGFLVRSSGQFFDIANTDKKITIDYTMNVLNGESVDFWQQKGDRTVIHRIRQIRIRNKRTA